VSFEPALAADFGIAARAEALGERFRASPLVVAPQAVASLAIFIKGGRVAKTQKAAFKQGEPEEKKNTNINLH